MPDIEHFFNAIDSARLDRAKELSELKRLLNSSSDDPLRVRSKSAVVLTYAIWEGFYNQYVKYYIEFLSSSGKKIVDVEWSMLIGALSAEFEALRARNHSAEARTAFLKSFRLCINKGFDIFDKNAVSARSNLNFSKISSCFSIMNFTTESLQPYRIRLDRELVGWRHGIAHGDSPDLTTVDIADHIDFASNLLLTISDVFQFEMSRRAS